MDSVSGHWVRQGNLIILNGLGPVATEEREFSRIFPWSVPNFPAKPAGAPGGFSLPVSLFPPKPPPIIGSPLCRHRMLGLTTCAFQMPREVSRALL